MDNIAGIDFSEKVDIIKLHKMAFIYNALENGWKVKKNGDCYVFTKNHGGKKEIFLDSYLKKFVKMNLDLENLQE
jgi:hypothetical protein